MTDDEHWRANLQIAQAVLDKLEREADPVMQSVYRSALSGVEEHLNAEREAEA